MLFPRLCDAVCCTLHARGLGRFQPPYDQRITKLHLQQSYKRKGCNERSPRARRNPVCMLPAKLRISSAACRKEYTKTLLQRADSVDKRSNDLKGVAKTASYAFDKQRTMSPHCKASESECSSTLRSGQRIGEGPDQGAACLSPDLKVAAPGFYSGWEAFVWGSARASCRASSCPDIRASKYRHAILARRLCWLCPR